MRRFIRILTVAFLCGILIVPPIEAQNRRGGGNQRSERTSGASSSRSKTPSSRPGSSDSRPNNNKPNNRPNNNRPGNSGRPSGNTRPNKPGGHAPAPRPHRPASPRPHRPTYMVPPPRPHRPVAHPWTRPLPPQAWRPYRGCPVINSILGITFGTAIGLSLDYLYNRGYVVDGYGSDVVYLRDVTAMSYYWPDVTLYYGSGGFNRSQFCYSTGYYDITRYNNLYSGFVAQYGVPVSVQNSGNVHIATWFGYNNGYISLEFRPMYTNGGVLRYYTTLTYGN